MWSSGNILALLKTINRQWDTWRRWDYIEGYWSKYLFIAYIFHQYWKACLWKSWRITNYVGRNPSQRGLPKPTFWTLEQEKYINPRSPSKNVNMWICMCDNRQTNSTWVIYITNNMWYVSDHLLKSDDLALRLKAIVLHKEANGWIENEDLFVSSRGTMFETVAWVARYPVFKITH